MVRIAVVDEGPGIPPGLRRVIFAAFERGGRDPSDPTPGVGLGLALARALAREHGGDLVHEAPAGGGAAFVLSLPELPAARSSG